MKTMIATMTMMTMTMTTIMNEGIHQPRSGGHRIRYVPKTNLSGVVRSRWLIHAWKQRRTASRFRLIAGAMMGVG